MNQDQNFDCTETEPLESWEAKFGPVGGGEALVGECVGLRFVNELGELPDSRAKQIGGLIPLRPGCFGAVLDDSGGEESAGCRRPLLPARPSA